MVKCGTITIILVVQLDNVRSDSVRTKLQQRTYYAEAKILN